MTTHYGGRRSTSVVDAPPDDNLRLVESHGCELPCMLACWIQTHAEALAFLLGEDSRSPMNDAIGCGVGGAGAGAARRRPGCDKEVKPATLN